jgi:hypothetical protein
VNRFRIPRLDENIIAHFLAISAMTFIMLVVCGLGGSSDSARPYDSAVTNAAAAQRN